MRWECSMVADLLRWLSDRNLDWFKADRQRTLLVYIEQIANMSMRRSHFGYVFMTNLLKRVDKNAA